MDRSSKQKINKEIRALNDILEQMGFTDIFRTFHPRATGYTFFSSAHGKFSRLSTSRSVTPVTNRVSTGTKILVSFPAYFQTTML